MMQNPISLLVGVYRHGEEKGMPDGESWTICSPNIMLLLLPANAKHFGFPLLEIWDLVWTVWWDDGEEVNF